MSTFFSVQFLARYWIIQIFCSAVIVKFKSLKEKYFSEISGSAISDDKTLHTVISYSDSRAFSPMQFQPIPLSTFLNFRPKRILTNWSWFARLSYWIEIDIDEPIMYLWNPPDSYC